MGLCKHHTARAARPSLCSPEAPCEPERACPGHSSALLPDSVWVMPCTKDKKRKYFSLTYISHFSDLSLFSLLSFWHCFTNSCWKKSHTVRSTLQPYSSTNKTCSQTMTLARGRLAGRPAAQHALRSPAPILCTPNWPISFATHCSRSGKSPFGSPPSRYDCSCKLLSVYTATPSAKPLFGINYMLGTEPGPQLSKPHQECCLRQQTIPQQLHFPSSFGSGDGPATQIDAAQSVVLLLSVFSFWEGCCAVPETWQHAASRGRPVESGGEGAEETSAPSHISQPLVHPSGSSTPGTHLICFCSWSRGQRSAKQKNWFPGTSPQVFLL